MPDLGAPTQPVAMDREMGDESLPSGWKPPEVIMCDPLELLAEFLWRFEGGVGEQVKPFHVQVEGVASEQRRPKQKGGCAKQQTGN